MQHRGYGWLRPEGVRRELEKMTAEWQGPPKMTWKTQAAEEERQRQEEPEKQAVRVRLLKVGAGEERRRQEEAEKQRRVLGKTHGNTSLMARIANLFSRKGKK